MRELSIVIDNDQEVMRYRISDPSWPEHCNNEIMRLPLDSAWKIMIMALDSAMNDSHIAPVPFRIRVRGLE